MSKEKEDFIEKLRDKIISETNPDKKQNYINVAKELITDWRVFLKTCNIEYNISYDNLYMIVNGMFKHSVKSQPFHSDCDDEEEYECVDVVTLLKKVKKFIETKTL